MTAYKLPNGEWIDLDHVQTISKMWRNGNGSFWHYLCNVTLAFQDKKKEIDLSSYSDYGIYGDAREKLDNEKKREAEKHYTHLLEAWKK